MNTPLIKLTIIFVTGILAGFYANLPVEPIITAILVLLAIFALVYFQAKNRLFQNELFGISTSILFFGMGFFTTTIHLPKNQEMHFIHHLSSFSSSEKIPVIKVEIREKLKPDLYYDKFVGKVISVSNQPSHGNILILAPKDSTITPTEVGDQLIIATEVKDIQKPLNPHQFDYNYYQANRGILGQTTLQPKLYRKLGTKKGVIRTAATWRNKIIRGLQEDGFKPEELAIIQALLLGQKKDITAETYNNYAAAGAIHILAVSGLHVGILLLLLNRLFSPLLNFKKGKILRTGLILLFLWGFAILAGLSPSVVRAVTMFSFLAIAMELNRRTSSINSLFLSLLLLLLIRPQWIFEVGFQLSYAAVLSIILLQPVLYKSLFPSNKVTKFFWGLLTTTIAAQAGVVPLSLFYFNQFPGLFFLSNLVILPFLGVILGTGILIILLSLASLSKYYLTLAFSEIIASLNSFVAYVARQEQYLFTDVSFSLPEVWTWYILVCSLIFLLRNFSYRKIMVVLLAIICLQSFYLYKAASIQEENLIIFHKMGGSILGKQKKDQITFYLSRTGQENKIMSNYVTGEGLEHVSFIPQHQFHVIKGEILMVIDSTGIYPKTLKPDYLLLTGSPKVNLDRIIQQLQPSVIIADGSNYRNQISNWKKTASKNKISFLYTGETGAVRVPD